MRMNSLLCRRIRTNKYARVSKYSSKSLNFHLILSGYVSILTSISFLIGSITSFSLSGALNVPVSSQLSMAT